MFRLPGLCERQASLTAAASTATEFSKSRRRRQKCREAIGIFISDLCAVVDTVKCVFDPECIVIGGGLIELRQYWLEDFLNALPDSDAHLIRPAVLGNDAGAIGAAYLLENSEIL